MSNRVPNSDTERGDVSDEVLMQSCGVEDGSTHTPERSYYATEEVIVCTPLAVVRPEELSGLELTVCEDGGRDISMWVKKRAKGFGRLLGVSCASYEDKIVELLMEIERGRSTSRKGGEGNRSKTRKRSDRELKQLSCSLNFEGVSSKEGTGRRKRINF